MGISTGVYYDAVKVSVCLLNFINKVTLMVGLIYFYINIFCNAMLFNFSHKVFVGFFSVMLRPSVPSAKRSAPICWCAVA